MEKLIATVVTLAPSVASAGGPRPVPVATWEYYLIALVILALLTALGLGAFRRKAGK